jgi:hypothetical protein
VLFPLITRSANQFQSAFLTVLPHGGQGAARRNAWSAMSADVVQSRARREAEIAVDLAADRASLRAARASS